MDFDKGINLKVITELQSQISKLNSTILEQQAQIAHLKNTLIINKINDVGDDITTIKQALDYEYLVLSGGGIKGVSFVGALQELDNMGILFKDGKLKLKGIAATSAGTIVGTMLGIGYTIQEITDIMNNTDFGKIINKGWYIGDIYNFFKKLGASDTDYLFNFMGKVIKDKTGSADYTYNDLYKSHGIKLVTTTTNVTKNSLTWLYPLHPTLGDTPIRVGVRMSTAVPFLFEPYMFDNCFHTDGGEMANYPIEAFDSENPDALNEIFWEPNYKVLGLKIRTHTSPEAQKINNVFDYAIAHIDTMLASGDTKSHLKANWCRTISIFTPSYSLATFSLTDIQKTSLIENGRTGVKDYFSS